MRILSVILLLIGSVAESLIFKRVDVPHYMETGEDAVLQCLFNMEGSRLYAVKWYKDNEEFFRYLPRHSPSIHTHQVDGVHVDPVLSNQTKVVLKSVNVRSTGVYRCEVSGEAPDFSSSMGEGRMTVVYLPQEGPQITGNVRDEYEVGDTLDLNCTSSKSFPPAKISWYINDKPIPQHHEPTYYETSGEAGPGGMGKGQGNGNSLIKATSRRLQLELHPNHFGAKGTAKVRCVARIFPLFWQEGDEKVVMGNSNRKSNDVDYIAHDSIHRHQTQGPKPRGGVLNKREALVQIRGDGTKLLASTKVNQIVLLLILCSHFLSS